MSPPPLPKPRRTRAVVLTCVLGLVLLPFLIGAAMYISFRVRNNKAVRRLEAKAREKGEPLTLSELAARYPSLPDDENGATALLRIWEKDDPSFWQAVKEGRRPLPPRSEPPADPALPFLGAEMKRPTRSGPVPPASLAVAEAYLRNQSERLEAVLSALNKQRFRFPVPVAEGYAAPVPYLTELKNEAQTFRIVALVSLEHGDVDGAIAALEDVQKTGQALAEGPLLLHQLVRVGCFAMVLEDSQRLLSREALSGPQLDRLEALFRRLQLPGALHSGLIAERASMLSVLDRPEQMRQLVGGEDGDRENERGMRVGMQVFTGLGLLAADRRLILETMEQAIALAGEDSPEALEQYERLFERVATDAPRFPPRLFSAILLPSLKKAGTKFASFEARRRAALVAVGIERYRTAHGGLLPERLESLMPAYLSQAPPDPYDGHPLRYRALPNGFVVYSVGEDRHDDGGKERPPKVSAGDNYDETFIVDRAGPR